MTSTYYLYTGGIITHFSIFIYSRILIFTTTMIKRYFISFTSINRVVEK